MNRTSTMESSARESSSVFERIVRIWYSVTSPREIQPGDRFEIRDAIRRSRTASWILLIVILLVLLPIPAALARPYDLIPLTIALLIDLFAFYLNRLRYTTAAGIITIFTIEAGLLGTLLSLPGGIGPVNLPLFDLLAQSVIVAAYMIGPGWGFVIMVLNTVIAWVLFHSGAISPSLSRLYAINASTFTQVIELQCIIAVFSFILVYSSNRAIKSLDRAEEIVTLEKREIERQEQEIEEKRKLAYGIEQILNALAAFSNGNSNARAPLAQDNILWRIAYALNTLFARLSSLRRTEVELEQANYRFDIAVQQRDEAAKKLELTEKAARSLIESIQGGILPAGKSGTVIDEILATVRRTGNEPIQQDSRPRR